MKVLKQLREDVNLTQEVVADKLDVSVSSIQNWERDDYYNITKENLHKLLDLYEVNQDKRNEVVLLAFGNDSYSSDVANSTDNFPYFLFGDRKDIMESARKTKLTETEMNVFGYVYQIVKTYKCECLSEMVKCPIDYQFLKDNGGCFKTWNIINEITKKIDIFRSDEKFGLSDLIFNFGVNHPGCSFNFCELDKESIIEHIDNLLYLEWPIEDLCDLYTCCKLVEEPVFIGTNLESALGRYRDYDSIEVKQIVRDNIYLRGDLPSYELEFKGIKGSCFNIYKVESQNKTNISKKNRYLLEHRNCDENPELLDTEQLVEPIFEYYVSITPLGRKYIEWYES